MMDEMGESITALILEQHEADGDDRDESMRVSESQQQRAQTQSALRAATTPSGFPDTISAEGLLELLRRRESETRAAAAGGAPPAPSTPLVLDVRTLSRFFDDGAPHIRDAVALSIPALLLRRLRARPQPLEVAHFVANERGRQVWASVSEHERRSDDDTSMIVVLDDDGSGSGTAATLAIVLAKQFASESAPFRIARLSTPFDRFCELSEAQKFLLYGPEAELASVAPSTSAAATSTIASHGGGMNGAAPQLGGTGKAPPPKLRRIDTTSTDNLRTARHNGHKTPRAPAPMAIQTNGGAGSLQALCYEQRRTSPSTPSFGCDRLRATPPRSPRARGRMLESSSSSSSSGPYSAAPLSARPPSTPTAGTTDESAPFTIAEIVPGFLYLGPEPSTERDLDELRSRGITHVLNAASECDGEQASKRFKRYLHLPLRDFVDEQNLMAALEQACAFLSDAQLRPGARAYVHCRAGRSRSVALALAFLVRRNRWSLQRAYAHVNAKREGGIAPNIGFVAELMRWEERERGRVSKGVLDHVAALRAPPGLVGERTDDDDDDDAGAAAGASDAGAPLLERSNSCMTGTVATSRPSLSRTSRVRQSMPLIELSGMTALGEDDHPKSTSDSLRSETNGGTKANSEAGPRRVTPPTLRVDRGGGGASPPLYNSRQPSPHRYVGLFSPSSDVTRRG